MSKFKVKYNLDQKSLISINDINKSYGKKEVLKGISYDFFEGETYAIIGANGSGKTTLIEIIAKIKEADSGNVYYRAKNEMGLGNLMATQHQKLTYPEGYKVIEVLEFFASVNTDSKDECERRLGQMIDVFDMQHIAHKRINALSGGEMQRVNIILALLDKSKVLILDEISTGLDASIYEEAMKFIEEYIKVNNITLIMISHHLEEIERFTKTSLILAGGILKEVKTSSITEKKYEEYIKSSQKADFVKVEIKKDIDFEKNKAKLMARDLKTKLFEFGDKIKINKNNTRDNKIPEGKIVATGITKKFGKKIAVDNVNLEVKQGETIALIGGNGAGKTTLVEMLAKVQNPTKGKFAYWWGLRNWEIKSGIGMQFQQSIYSDDLKVWEVLELFARSSDFSMTWAQIADLAEKFGLGEVWNSAAGSLSGGQRQKVNVLIALLKKPQLIILDEISTGLDILSRKEIIALVKDYVKKNNLTLILISHHADEIKELTNKVFIIDQGKIINEVTLEGKTIESIKKLLKDNSSRVSEGGEK